MERRTVRLRFTGSNRVLLLSSNPSLVSFRERKISSVLNLGSPICIHFDKSHESRYDGSIPFRIGLPFEQGVKFCADEISIECWGQATHLIQAKTLQLWPDGSIKWCLIYWLQRASGARSQENVRLVDFKAEVEWLANRNEISIYCSRSPSKKLELRIRANDSHGTEYIASCDSFQSTEAGAIYSRMLGNATLQDSSGNQLPFGVQVAIESFSGASTVIFQVTICNPQTAAHPNGNWDLGNKGSFFLRDLSVELQWNSDLSATTIQVQTNPDETPGAAKSSATLFQASSGGENWNSLNHIDKDRKVSLPFRGYRLDIDGESSEGLRATPQVTVSGDDWTAAVAVRRYWENFPKVLQATRTRIRLGLFPEESGYLHEIQGGEQKTHEFAVYFGERTETPPLDWYVDPVHVRLDPAYLASTGAIPYLTPRDSDPNDCHHQLVDQAIEGENTFVAKREKIDEYGWRNFGDIYGDHEAVHHTGPTPLISHYNNQYDCTGAFAMQYFRTGDHRWFDQMLASADHAWDIDTYHTAGDKSLYNGGLFWHTYHYADADTGTHRSYPRSLCQSTGMQGGQDLELLGDTGQKLKKNYAIGGGPSASHNYSTGWMFAYFLTGETRYREAAISAADYVIQIEDGTKTIFRWLSTANTGYSIESSAGYYGPGRASANSLHALLTGYELSNDRKYLDFAERLIRRVVHPEDVIEKLDLLNAELRWFYTMFLQALTRYIDLKSIFGQNDMMYAYARASLDHYAKWMLAHEHPTLDHPERLQYPNETWAAQDMRKWHILQCAAWANRSDVSLSQSLQAKADFFFEYVCDTLHSMPTRSLCRPVILMMQFGWQRNWFQTLGKDEELLVSTFESSLPAKETMQPQRSIAIKRAKQILIAGALIGLIALIAIFGISVRILAH